MIKALRKMCRQKSKNALKSAFDTFRYSAYQKLIEEKEFEIQNIYEEYQEQR